MRQLVLERFGGGGNNDSRPEGERRHEVGEALAGPRTRLDYKVDASA